VRRHVSLKLHVSTAIVAGAQLGIVVGIAQPLAGHEN